MNNQNNIGIAALELNYSTEDLLFDDWVDVFDPINKNINIGKIQLRIEFVYSDVSIFF